MTSPLVSIVIPVYNGANYLREAVDSALAQSYREKEVIVVNDGSSDGGETEEICLSYGDRIRYRKKENGGVATALNLAIEEMRGEYFSWLSHDDMYRPDKLEKQMLALGKAPDKTMIVHGNYDLINVSLENVSHIRQETAYSEEQLTNSVFPVLTAVIHGCTPLIHRSHFARVGFFDEGQPLTQDYDFLFRALRGGRSIFLPEPLVRVRLHGQAGRIADGRFAQACANQYVNFLDALPYNEIQKMFPSPRAFYFKIAGMIGSRLDRAAANTILRRMELLPEEFADNRSQRLRSFIERRGGGKMPGICIFGAGFHGKVLQFELRGRGVTVDFFCDNDTKKHGASINDTPCVSLAELGRRKHGMLVIVAADDSAGMMTQLERAGITRVASKTEFDALFLECPPNPGAGEYA